MQIAADLVVSIFIETLWVSYGNATFLASLALGMTMPWLKTRLRS